MNIGTWSGEITDDGGWEALPPIEDRAAAGFSCKPDVDGGMACEPIGGAWPGRGAAPFIPTVSGMRFYLLDPAPGDVRIGDIAHGLSNTGRFAGQTIAFYSVAQHSVLVADLLKDWGCPRETQLQGLLHDAAEAYTGDLPGPLKDHVPAYREIEERILRAVCTRFGVRWPFEIKVHEADDALLHWEGRSMVNGWKALGRPADDPPGFDWPSRCWPVAPAEAKAEFLRRYEELKEPPMAAKREAVVLAKAETDGVAPAPEPYAAEIEAENAGKEGAAYREGGEAWEARTSFLGLRYEAGCAAERLYAMHREAGWLDAMARRVWRNTQSGIA